MNYAELTASLEPLYGRGEAKAIARMVMEERFGLSQTDILLGRDAGLSLKERSELEIIASRLAKGQPVQHVLGYATFCGRRFRVTPDVLIPRPETEEIIGNVMDFCRQAASLEGRQSMSIGERLSALTGEVLDLGTGSGCIAITLALLLPKAHITAVDISEAALAVALENAANLGADNVEFLQHDMLDTEGLTAHITHRTHQLADRDSHVSTSCLTTSQSTTYDIIVSNPPYVRQNEAASMHTNVLEHEPHTALFVPDDDPLIFYRAIADIADRHLAHDGLLMVEINSALPHPTAAIFQERGFATEILTDQFGQPRFVKARRNPNHT